MNDWPREDGESVKWLVRQIASARSVPATRVVSDAVDTYIHVTRPPYDADFSKKLLHSVDISGRRVHSYYDDSVN